MVVENRVCIGQQKVEGKSNEITATTKLIEQLDISGSVITIDAMGCQRSIAELTIDQEADYLLALKENQAGLLEEVEFTNPCQGCGQKTAQRQRNGD